MDLYLVRHGIAQERTDPGVRSDAERELTPEGVERTRVAAEGLRRMGVRVSRIGTSPLTRAEQTAEIMLEAVGAGAEFEECDFLARGATRDLIAWLRRLKDESVMVVGHMPNLADDLSALVSANDDVSLTFKKVGVACVHFPAEPEAGQGILLWLMPPKGLRLAGGGED